MNEKIVTEISIVEMHHENTDEGIFVWGAGATETGMRRWAAHMHKRSEGNPESDWTEAFDECQKKIVAAVNQAISADATITEATPVTETTETPETVQTPDDNPEEKEKIIRGARELFRQDQTEIVAKELGIDKGKIYGEAQRLWGTDEKWNIEIWNKFTQATAEFHQRTGVLYNALKPQTDANGKAPGPF